MAAKRAGEGMELSRQAQAAFDAADFGRARELAERAVHAADKSPQQGARSAARRVLALSLLYADRAEEARRLAEEAVRIARGARADAEEALCELVLAEILRARGDTTEALRRASRAHALGLRAGDPATTRSVLADYAVLLARAGDGERARGLFELAIAMPSAGQSAPREFRVLYNAATMHRAAGRFELSLRMLDRAEEVVVRAGLRAAEWPLRAARLFALIDVGALDEVTVQLAGARLTDASPAWQRAQLAGFTAAAALLAGERPEKVERLVNEGLAIPDVERPTRFALERLRGLALLARGRSEDAERIAIGLTALATRGGTRAEAAQAMALAARAGNQEAWLLRWLGAASLSGGGVSARTEHEAMAALAAEPEPIGQLARNAITLLRARLVENTPAHHRASLRHTLRLVETRLDGVRKARRAETETSLTDAVVRAKEEVGIAGKSPALLRAVGQLSRASKSDASVVLVGETGSGKELFARLAHRLSDRARGPFVAINCGALAEPLLEAELFGHERGAFTGAERARRGLFVEAESGTLFLDEVGEMSPAMQVKLLRVLEDREVRAVGGNKSRKVDVRVVAATHRDLGAMVAAGSFREDLFYRLAAITVRVPALRERPEDIPTVARALLARDPAMRGHRLDVPALSLLAEHSWPGNVRELANVLRVAAAMASGDVIGRPDLEEALGPGVGPRTETRTSALEETTLAALRARHRAELRELVGRAIARVDGNKLRAARSLGVSRQGLYRVLGES
jgi:DNA-binding NtrC family response regulator/tetratricopeptide (TPR) repeat protein